MHHVDAHSLYLLVKRVLEGMGCPESEAAVVSEHLVESNLQGHDSHGVQMMMLYHQGILSGRMKGGVEIEVEEEGPVLRVTGGRGGVHSFGHKTLKETVEIAVKKAKLQGVAVISYKGGGHIGRLGSYGQQVASEKLMGIFMAGVGDHDPLVSLYGGTSAVVCTNPFCIALPSENDEVGDFILDFATSKVALGKIKNMIAKGMDTIPPGLVLDHDGSPSTDPHVVIEQPKGALTSFGDHKGSGLALAVELIASGLTGWGTLHPKNPRHCTLADQSPVNNVFAVILNPTLLGGNLSEVSSFMQFVRTTRRATSTTPILLPGEPEQLMKTNRLANGIPLPPPVYDGILETAALYGIPREEAEGILSRKAKL